MDISNEDVHMAVEEAVLQQIGPDVWGNMHIAKSRKRTKLPLPSVWSCEETR